MIKFFKASEVCLHSGQLPSFATEPEPRNETAELTWCANLVTTDYSE